MSERTYDIINLYEEEKRFKDILLPLIAQLLDEDAPRNITVNEYLELCINGTVISHDFRFATEFSTDIISNVLTFSDNGIFRGVDFGVKGYEKRDKVYRIFHYSRRTGSRVYDYDLIYYGNSSNNKIGGLS